MTEEYLQVLISIHRVWTRCTKDRSWPACDHRLRADRDTLDFPLLVQHRQFLSGRLQALLQEGLLRHFLLQEMRTQTQKREAPDEATEGDGRPEEHFLDWSRRQLHRLWSRS